jgi:hypothetical protein
MSGEKMGHGDKAEALKLLLKRFLISLPFFAISVYLFLSPFPANLLAVFPLVMPAFIMARPITALVFNRAGYIFNPKSGNTEINLNFSLIEAEIMERRYDEALDMLEAMIPRAPERLEIYMRMMNLVSTHMGQPERVREVFKIGMKNLKDLGSRNVLAQEYRRLKLLNSVPEDCWTEIGST